jgi:hypothetical protein
MNEVLKLIEVIKSKITVDCDLTWTLYNAVEELIA